MMPSTIANYKNNTAYVLMPLTISTRASFPDHICKPAYTPFGCQKDMQLEKKLQGFLSTTLAI